jgi:hypothetical protein
MAKGSNAVNDRKGDEAMRKVLGIALATLFTLPLIAAAEEVSVRSFAADNGTQITVSEKPIADLAAGDQVKATFETDGGKQLITPSDSRPTGSEFRSTNSWAPVYGTAMDSIQSE